MNPFELQLAALVRCLNALKIEYAIIGGVAVAMHGEPRFTADIDISIFLDKKSIGPFLKDIKKYGFLPVATKAKEFAERCGVIPLHFSKQGVSGSFDIILAENPIEYTAIKRARTAKIGSVVAMVISPEDLVIHKLSSARPRDFEDVEGVLLRQRGKLDLKYIRRWLKRIDASDASLGLGKIFERLLKARK